MQRIVLRYKAERFIPNEKKVLKLFKESPPFHAMNGMASLPREENI